ncbi:MAG TPA: CPBP family glutamic-type intramembrane protease, partial [Terriglobia bacterium]|nr:CPBP family glutamic-type intramembrane protease [Terriglobia bacterium]
AIKAPGAIGQTFYVVGPDRLTLRGVVERVAASLGLPITIWATPVALMRFPVWFMERTMRQPLSTRAQLAMLEEGMDGDPEPARRTLGLVTAPFTAERIRPVTETARRSSPFRLRLFSAPRPAAETSPALFLTLLVFALAALSFVFGFVSDAWMGMTLAMGGALAIALTLPAVRRLNPSISRIVLGLVAGLALYGLTRGIAGFLLPPLWPGWERGAGALYAWKGRHSWPFLAPTLVMIVFAEEAVWRGVIARWLMERWGRPAGVAAGAALYAACHWAAFSPLLLVAALGCGLFWGWLYAATDDLVTPTVSHLLWDALLLTFPLV